MLQYGVQLAETAGTSMYVFGSEHGAASEKIKDNSNQLNTLLFGGASKWANRAIAYAVVYKGHRLSPTEVTTGNIIRKYTRGLTPLERRGSRVDDWKRVKSMVHGW